jgi:putative aldouronate transport system permease protein
MAKSKFSFAKEYRGRTIFNIFNFIFFVLVTIAMLVPIIKVFVDSIDLQSGYGLSLWPKEPTLEGYKIIITEKTLWMPFVISVITTIGGTFMGLMIATIGAYILIQTDMPGVKFFSWMFMFTMIFNGGLVPTYLVIKQLHLLNTLWAILFTLGMNVYNLVLMRSFFEQIPESLFEAAEIDGCSPMGIFIKIVLPLSKPALASIGLFYAVAAWSEYFHYVLYITDTNLFNFQVKLRSLILDDTPIPAAEKAGIRMNTIKNASIIVAIIPFMFIYPFCQKYFVTGVTMGAVKE